jgi:hypothetical protein
MATIADQRSAVRGGGVRARCLGYDFPVSGSTMIRQQGRRYELRLETPSISFMPEPDRPGEPTQEQRYHASAARR